MRQKMSRRLVNMKRAKGKCSSEAKGSNKSAAGRRKDIKRPKTDTTDSAAEAPQRCSVVCSHGNPANPSEAFSQSSCDPCSSPDGIRCPSSPEPKGPEGKENEARTRLKSDCRAVDGFPEKSEGEEMDERLSDKNFYPDDDSNQILPVEQFFGNLDMVQDCPERPATSSSSWCGREQRRHRYYAKDNTEEEEEAMGFTHMQEEARGQS